MSLDPALNYARSHFETFLSELVEYSKIPSVSFPDFPAAPLQAAADWTLARLRNAGLEHVQILNIEGAPPYVYGDWLHAGVAAPTVLLYAHHDVQPPGREDKWHSHPFKPELRNGRLFGRGTADDKGGVMMHVAALESFLKTNGQLPINIRFIIEGEEETGSQHLSAFLEQYQDLLKADVMILTDTANLEVGLPTLTYRLRGIVDAAITVSTIKHPLHSGMWGGPIVDAISALAQILAKLYNSDGSIAIPGFYEDVAPLTPKEKANLESLPFDEARFRGEAGMNDGLKFIGNPAATVYERIWCQPALAILGIDAPSLASTSNKLVESASAKISLRIVNHQNPKKIMQQLKEYIAQITPWGATVDFKPGVANPPWCMDANGPAFVAAEKALKLGYGVDPVYSGCGGSIPFVKPLTDAFPKMPALLIGVEDPLTNAHGENESLCVADWQKGIVAAIHLYQELAFKS